MVLGRHPNKRIAVLDSRSVGPELALCVHKITEFLKNNADFDSIVKMASSFFKNTKILFALSSFDNLVKNGRMRKISGFLAKKLGMWGIGAGSEEGKIEIKGRARGSVKAVSMLLKEMDKCGLSNGRVMVSHCQNPVFAQKLKSKIQEHWRDVEVCILSTRGLCSYYAERGGLIISY